MCIVVLATLVGCQIPDDRFVGCADTRNDPLHCGGCGRRCADLPGVDGSRVTCTAGRCDIAAACSPGAGDCDGIESTGCEADLRSPATCGSCTMQCGDAAPLCTATGTSYACSASCGTDETECSGTCADVASDSAHCGRCDRSCGGGDCVAGQCQPVAVATGRSGPVELAVTGDAIYWSEAGAGVMDGKIATCPLPGCSLAPRFIGDARGRIGVLAVAGTDVYFAGCSGDSCDDNIQLYRCPVAGCPALPQSIASDVSLTWTDIRVGATHVYGVAPFSVVGCLPSDCAGTRQSWPASAFGGGTGSLQGIALVGDTLFVSAGAGLRSCPEAQGCAAPAAVANTTAVAAPFRAHAGRLYWFSPFSPGVVRVLSCAAASCSAQLFAQESEGVSEIEIDDSGVYWMNAMTGTIRHCPITGCVGAPGTVATGLVAPKALTLGTAFVYWIEGNDIRRAAKL